MEKNDVRLTQLIQSFDLAVGQDFDLDRLLQEGTRPTEERICARFCNPTI